MGKEKTPPLKLENDMLYQDVEALDDSIEDEIKTLEKKTFARTPL